VAVKKTHEMAENACDFEVDLLFFENQKA